MPGNLDTSPGEKSDSAAETVDFFQQVQKERERDSQISMIPPVLRKRPETGVADMQQRHLNKGVSLSSALVQLNNLDKRPAFHTRNELKNAKRVVIKLGSTVVTR